MGILACSLLWVMQDLYHQLQHYLLGMILVATVAARRNPKEQSCEFLMLLYLPLMITTSWIETPLSTQMLPQGFPRSGIDHL